jgi:hypothetical protein
VRVAAGGWVDRGMAQVVPDPDSAWVAGGWVAAAAAALAEVVAAGVARLEGVVRVVAACGNPVAGPEAKELGAEAAGLVVGAVVALEVEPGPVAVVLAAPAGLALVVDLEVEAGPGELEVVVAEAVAEPEDMEVDLDPAAELERAPEGREAEAKRVRQGNG